MVLLQHWNKELCHLHPLLCCSAMHCRALQCYTSAATLAQYSPLPTICPICKFNVWVIPTVYQGAYNIINRAGDAELVAVIRRFGIQWVAFNPIAGGLLAARSRAREICRPKAASLREWGSQVNLITESKAKNIRTDGSPGLLFTIGQILPRPDI
jgi:hypothetical protein